MSFCNITLLNWRKCKIELLSFQVSTTLILNSQNAVTILQYVHTTQKFVPLSLKFFFANFWIFNEFENPLLFREWFFPNELKKQEKIVPLLEKCDKSNKIAPFYWLEMPISEVWVCTYVYYYCTQIVFVCIFFTINPRTNLWPFFVTPFFQLWLRTPKRLIKTLTTSASQKCSQLIQFGWV